MGLVLVVGCTAEDDEARCPISEVRPSPGAAELGVGMLSVDGEPACTVALVARDRVLTAAHCVIDRDVATLDVAFLPAGQDTIRRSVSSVRLHPDFDGRSSGGPDVALLSLSDPIDLIPSAALMRCDQCSLQGVEAYAHGYGLDPDEALIPLPTEGRVVLVEASDGRLQIDSTGSEFTPCKGDSGAPVFVWMAERPHVVGLISGGSLDCQQTAWLTRLDGTVQTWLMAAGDVTVAACER